MAHLHKSKLSLRISGDSLVPAEVTALLGAEPTFSHSKGEEIRINQTGQVRVAQTGMWLKSVDDRTPENLDGQLRKLFDEMSDDLSVWQRIHETYSADLFCGLFMQGFNEGLTISASVMKMIADRRLEIGFDIYGGEPTPETTG
ncbi:MAG: DUF4279 domain-containing protein [Pirellulales bacterium]|nr:DUF4279 domain-containing protein [Pirellulales bacterium]